MQQQEDHNGRDSPISVVDNDEQESNILRNETSAMSLGYRQPDNPVQLISYLALQNKKKKQKIPEMLPARKPIKSSTSKMKMADPIRID